MPRKIPRHRSPSRRIHQEIAEHARKAEIVERRRERKAETRARVRVERGRTAVETGLRAVRFIARFPSPAALDRLARFCRDLDQPHEVRSAAARAILVLANGPTPRQGPNHGNEG